jgi:excisionase family DNA binding protein
MKTIEPSSTQAPTRPEDSLLTVEEVAALLRVDASWVYERVRRRSVDRLPGFHVGKYLRFRNADVLAWLDRQRAGGRTNA